MRPISGRATATARTSTGDDISFELARLRVAGGAETTVYVVRHPIATTRVRLQWFADPVHLDRWCSQTRHPEAIVAGFFLRDPWRALGEVRLAGDAVPHEAVADPWGPERGCVQLEDGVVRIARRADLPPQPGGDLVQAGPLLVADGTSLVDGDDREGFSAGAAQFDSDITAERHPRCALGVSDTHVLAVCCDGRRTGVDAGLDLAELARFLISAGATAAINLDGGGSATLVHRGHLLNRPYTDQDQHAPASRPIVTALLFDPR